ncbi:VPS10 domain-containing protein [Maribacter sp. 2304DJ31-5]|uniref:VPS10 domain-containing protein n=1 Tax=Maribacter sp. 2304DJ31-5 TaxID=3386273 RepID=UPI0039BC8AA5
MRFFYLFAFLWIPLAAAQVKPTPAQKILQGLEQKAEMESTSIIQHIPLKNIGPSVMSGRVVDVAVNPENPNEFYVGYASGGVWHTINNGTTFVPIMDNSGTQNIGDIAVHWNSRTIWVGTGENNASRSSYAGMGLLRSMDNGKTWQHMGLQDSHHIGRIRINPENPDEVVVGVTGHLYSPNAERGIYKTTDGGNTWKKTLFVSDETGIIDVAHAPEDFNIMFAAAWEKDRKAWDFKGSGNTSGIYKSTNGGNTWIKISTVESGFPTGEGVGRIGLAVFNATTVYAVHDNQFRRPKKSGEQKKTDGLVKEDFKTMSTKDFLSLNDKKLNTFLKTHNFQEKYRADNVKQMVRSGAVLPIDLTKYLENANSRLFDTPVIGAEVYRSNDGGKTWKKQNEEYIDDLFYSYGYYFAQITVDPSNVDKIYLAGVPIIKSNDGGKTYSAINKDNVHADHHALWVNPRMSGHLINGNDGGINISYDDGENWIKNNASSVAQFYAINVDNQKPYNVYGGLQDNGVWKGPHNGEENSKWHQTGHYPWESILGGDGMQVQIDNRNSDIVYTGYQFGNYFRLDLQHKKRKYIQPKHELGEVPYRFNWQTPILLSPHNQDILYLGGNKLHRSMNQGDDWETISPDLTKGGKEGNVAYGTLTTLSESPFKFGLIYTGSDDGLVQVTHNGGGSWENLSIGIPFDSSKIKIGVSSNGLKAKTPELWVSRIAASIHKKERVYVSLNGYRWDDFTPYIYVSEDYGKSWKNIASNIPAAPVNVILEDPENENLLFAGTDNGLYVSFDQGASWEVFQNGMPNVAVHDLVIQPRAKHLLVGTHGRSIYKADISKLQLMTPELMDKNLHVFPLQPIKHSKNWGNASSPWTNPKTPGADLVFYSSRSDNFTARVMSSDGIELSKTIVKADRGLNILSFDIAFSKLGKMNYLKKHKTALTQAKNGKTYLPKGTYTIILNGNGTKEKVDLNLK